ncbi:MAG TPA: hypothetical protein PLU17_02885 [Chitinophagaceae bacterium]|nr:hypothetical protein [Chitinophagaceae bacterium]
MNYILFFSSSILVGITNSAFSISLQEALTNKQIKISVTANSANNNPSASSHTGKCLKLDFNNASQNAIQIIIENAIVFENQEVKNQDLISCERKEINLSGNQNKTIYMNALCYEKNNSSPSPLDTFKFKLKESGSIERLCQLLSKQKNFGNTAQQAMWCFTNNASINDMIDTHEDQLVEDELIKFVANEKGIPSPQRKTTPIRILRYAIETEGSYTQWVEKPIKIGIYITDSTNTILITLMPEEIENRINGKLKYSYGYRGLLPKGKYYLQAKINGEWKKEKEIIVDDNQS